VSESLSLKNFTVFEELEMNFSPGINLIIGANGTGKTHILKIIYALLASSPDYYSAINKIHSVFLPAKGELGDELGHLVHWGAWEAEVDLIQDGKLLRIGFDAEGVARDERSIMEPAHVVYIPVKEMLSNAPGFRSLYNLRETYFESIYVDIIDKAFLPPLKEPLSGKRYKELLTTIQQIMEGTISQKGEHFYLSNEQGELEFMLLAEGLRKFALLWLLIRNGSLRSGTTLLWDEPEANLNPALIKMLVRILIELQREGVQIFIATHNYILLREFDLQTTQTDAIRFFSLAKDSDTKQITCQIGGSYSSIVPNEISESYLEIYDKEVARALSL